MDNKFTSVGSTVDVFTGTLLEEISKGLEEQGFATCSESESHIKLELYAKEVQAVGGGLTIHIFNASAKEEGSNAQKVTVYAKKIDEVEQAERNARLAEAKKREAIADATFGPSLMGNV